MMVSAAQRYARFPETIFDLRCSQLRANRMIQVLTYYKKRCPRHTKKERMLDLMVSLEKELGPEDIEVISSWLQSSRSGSALRKMLNGTSRAVEGFSNEELEVVNPQQECSVCMESYDGSHYSRKKLSVQCQHEHSICRACLSQSINAQIPEVAWDQVQCPECPEILAFATVKKWASKEAFEKYERKSVMAAFKDVPSFTMCLGPGCDSGQIHFGEHDQPIMTCNRCRFKTCYTHKMPWHSGQTCKAYEAEKRERMGQEAASVLLIARTTKPCPQCRAPIEKNGGCDHMSCEKCRHQFCFLCAAPWREIQRVSNSAHDPACDYHSDNLPARPNQRLTNPNIRYDAWAFQ